MKTILAALGIIMLFSACGGSSSSSTTTVPSVSGIAAMIMGPSTTASTTSSSLREARRGSKLMTSGNFWTLTPDQATVSFASVQFIMSSGNVVNSSMTSCSGTYSKTSASGSQLFTCPVAVPIGTINAIGVTTSASAAITINDSTNEIFTTPGSATGITIGVTSPSGLGATTVTIPNTGNGDPTQYPVVEYLTSPLVVTAQSTPSVYIVVDMIHTLTAQDNGSNGLVVQTATPFPPTRIFASFSAGATAEYYTTTGTDGNANLGSSNADNFVTVDYTASGQANHIFTALCSGANPSEAWSVAPANSPTGQNGLSAGGYLGLNGGTLSFALPSAFTWATYIAYAQMDRAAALTDSTTLNCDVNLSGLTPPTPTDGNSYASGGAVAFGSFSGTHSTVSTTGLVLVAH